MTKFQTVALTLGLLVMTAVLTPSSLRLHAFGPGDMMQVLTPLFMIALVTERALEVFVNTWRAPGMDELGLKMRQRRKALKEAQRAGTRADDVLKALRELEVECQKYRADTHRFALRLGFILGVAVSAVGVRTLEGLLAPGALPPTLSPFHQTAFHTLDVLLTGGVIAGGSDAIHKLIQLVTTFLETTTRHVKAGPGGNAEDDVTAWAGPAETPTEPPPPGDARAPQ